MNGFFAAAISVNVRVVHFPHQSRHSQPRRAAKTVNARDQVALGNRLPKFASELCVANFAVTNGVPARDDRRTASGQARQRENRHAEGAPGSSACEDHPRNDAPLGRGRCVQTAQTDRKVRRAPDFPRCSPARQSCSGVTFSPGCSLGSRSCKRAASSTTTTTTSLASALTTMTRSTRRTRGRGGGGGRQGAEALHRLGGLVGCEAAEEVLSITVSELAVRDVVGRVDGEGVCEAWIRTTRVHGGVELDSVDIRVHTSRDVQLNELIDADLLDDLHRVRVVRAVEG